MRPLRWLRATVSSHPWLTLVLALIAISAPWSGHATYRCRDCLARRFSEYRGLWRMELARTERIERNDLVADLAPPCGEHAWRLEQRGERGVTARTYCTLGRGVLSPFAWDLQDHPGFAAWVRDRVARGEVPRADARRLVVRPTSLRREDADRWTPAEHARIGELGKSLLASYRASLRGSSTVDPGRYHIDNW